MKDIIGEGSLDQIKFDSINLDKLNSNEVWASILPFISSALDNYDLKYFKSWYITRRIPLWGAGGDISGKTHVDSLVRFLLTKYNDSKWLHALKVDRKYFLSETHIDFTQINSVLSDTTIVNHVLHWLYLFECGIDSFDLECIFEFGGGCGHIPKLVDILGFTGSYIIYDFPELSEIQNYYNDYKIKTVNSINRVSDWLDVISKRNSLFYSTWAFSEIPIEDRIFFENLLDLFQGCLILYQSKFRDIDNKKYFSELVEKKDKFNWTIKEHPSVWDGGSKYIIGLK